MRLKTSYDLVSDSISIKEEGCQILSSRESDDDCNLLLQYDRKGRVVGIQLLEASNVKDYPHWVDEYPIRAVYKDAIREMLNL